MTTTPGHTPAPLAFADTETDSLLPDRRPWDIGIIRREPDGSEATLSIIVDDVDLTHADPRALAIGHFFQRHPSYGGTSAGLRLPEDKAARQVEEMLRGAHIIGCVPDFDVEVLKNMFRRHWLPWTAHYHLIDVENLIVGYLAGRRGDDEEIGTYTVDTGTCKARTVPLTPPWSSDDLSRAIGVEPPGPDERHTALGDARWAQRLYDRIMLTGALREDG